MKSSKYLTACGALLLAAAALTACSDDEKYDVDGSNANLISLTPSAVKVTECTIYHTPVGSFGDARVDLPAKIQYTATDSVTLTAKADTSLVSAYNEEYGAECVSVPQSVIDALEITPAGISAGANVASAPVEVVIPEAARTALTAPEYVLPVRLSLAGSYRGTDGRPVAASETMAVSYLVIHTTSDLAYLSGNTTAKTSIVNTPVGVFGGISAKFTAALHHAIGSDAKVSVTVDGSLVSAYNTANGTAYEQVPSDVVSALTVTPGTITAGETSAVVSVEAPLDKCGSLTKPAYLLPVRLTITYSGGTTQTVESAVGYIIITVEESLVQDSPSALVGTPCEDGDTEWTCLSANNLDPDAMSTSGWALQGNDASSSDFVVDLGRERKFTAFTVYSYVINSEKTRVYLSRDNKTWTDLGSVEGKSTVRGNRYSEQWYVLYGGVSARYVKVVLDIDRESWAWPYASWGYCDLQYNFAFDD